MAQIILWNDYSLPVLLPWSSPFDFVQIRTNDYAADHTTHRGDTLSYASKNIFYYSYYIKLELK